MRYAIALTSALLLGGATATLALQPAAQAQTAQNEPGAISASVPRAGAPMSFADMVAKLQPAVVNISTKQTITVAQNANPFAGTPFGDLFGQLNGGGSGNGAPVKREGQSLGSGFIISPDGYIVTNNHVISAGTKGATVDSITVTLQDRKEYVAKLIGRDQTSDLALLKVEASGLPFVRFGDSTRSRVGDWVIAIGNPFGLGGTVTAGIVSAVHRVTGLGANDRFIQTDASINRGNSGGPMFDLQGNVIGINSQILGSETGGNIGIGFAIPAETAKPIVDTLMRGGRVARGYIGIGLGGPVDDDVSAALGIPKNVGEVILRVEPNGPAAKSGLKPGDVVTGINGQQVNSDNTLSRLIAEVKPGSSARLDLLRDGRVVSLSVTVASRPPEDEIAAALPGGDDGGFGSDDNNSSSAATAMGGPTGVVVQLLTPGIANAVGVPTNTQGVVVSSVDGSTDAGQKLKRGDVISQVNGTPVRTSDEFNRAVAAAKSAGRPQVLLFVQRGRNANGLIAVKLRN